MSIVELVIRGVPSRLVLEDQGFNVKDQISDVRVDLNVNFTPSVEKADYASVSGHVTRGKQRFSVAGTYEPAIESTVTFTTALPEEVMHAVKDAIDKAFKASSLY